MEAAFHITDNVGDIVTRLPKADEVFKQYRIDFCCGGNRPLKEVIAEKGLDEAEILQKLNDMYEAARARNNEETNWEKAAYSELIDHVVNRHHAYLYSELPQLSTYVSKVYRVHGSNHPELNDVFKLFHALKMEVEQHIIKEEEEIFPLIKEYELDPDAAKLKHVNQLIDTLEQEHEESGNLLKELRKVTDDYKLPPGACNTYTLTYQKLEALEEDLFRHIHLENNILFPRLANER